MTKKYHEAPLVQRTPISIIVLPGCDTESTALRSVLEFFGYHVDLHLVGSRKEFIELLKGSIPTQETVVLCCHGNEKGIIVDDEKPVSTNDIKLHCKFDGKTVLSMGCATGSKEFIHAFRKNAGCTTYIAPTSYPFGNTALLFAIHVLYACRQHKKGIKDAVRTARKFDRESRMFNCW